MKLFGNTFDRFEAAGAFGDLGTLIPFIAGYFAILHVNPCGVLAVFGICNILAGLYYKTPVPVQPMKAIGAAAIAMPALATPSALSWAALATAALWLLLSATDAITFIRRFMTRPVIRGIIFGLGISFIVSGLKMGAETWWLFIIGLTVTLLLLNFKRLPVMFLLLLIGIVFSLITSSETLSAFLSIKPGFQLPSFTLPDLSMQDLFTGVILLALPQVPLTLGNGILALEEENNRLFPDRSTTSRKVAISTGLMNLFGGLFGGVPVCHGAGGMAGHVRFGAHTGGATIILGGLLLVIGLFFSQSVGTIFLLFPRAILGVILFFAGGELCLSARDVGSDKKDFYLFATVAGIAFFNAGAAFVYGVIVNKLMEKNIINL